MKISSREMCLFDIYGVKFKLLAEKSLIDYAKLNYKSFIVKSYSDNIDEFNKISISIGSLKPIKSKGFVSSRMYIGSEIGISDDFEDIEYIDNRLAIKVKRIGPNSLEIEAEANYSVAQKFLYCIGYRNSLANKHQEIFRYAVEYIIYYQLLIRGYSIVHAAVIAGYDKSASLLLGLNGAGKSTFLTQFKESFSQCKMLGDNYCAIKNGKVYPLANAIRAVNASSEFIYKPYGKSVCSNSNELDKNGYVVKQLYFVGRDRMKRKSIRYKCWRHSRALAANFILAQGYYLKELPLNQYPSLFSDNMHDFSGRIQQDIDNIFLLTNNVDSIYFAEFE